MIKLIANRPLKEVYTPCPNIVDQNGEIRVCGGTTDINYHGTPYCESCGKKWTLRGRPLKEEKIWLDILARL